MTSKFRDVNTLLNYFDSCQAKVDRKKSIVNRFLTNLNTKINDGPNLIIKGSKIYKVGSSYENTAVTPEADFDIALALPFPFIMDFFKVNYIYMHQRRIYWKGGKGENTPFTLKCVEVNKEVSKLKCTSGKKHLQPFINKNGFLKVEQLKNEIFKELSSIIDDMKIAGFKIKYVSKLSALTVTLTDAEGEEEVKMDIAMQIKANVDDVPGWANPENLPESISDVIKENDLIVLYNLSCPVDQKNKNYSHLAVQPTFNLLEKEGMLGSDIVGDAVRIAKSVCKKYNWMKKGLRSFQIKRIALGLFEEIEESEEPWEGYEIIMESMIEMLEEGKIHGYFIEGQNIMCKNEQACKKLAGEIKETVRNVHHNNILRRLGLSY